MVDVAQLTIKVDTTDLARGESALEGLQREGKQTEQAFDRLGNAAKRSGQGAQQFGRAARRAGSAGGAAGRQLQNASFQIGDFAVQMASGQRASTALAQQLPQLLGGFGVLGAVLGAVVAVGAALAPVLFKMGEEAGDASEQLESLNEISSKLKETMKVLELDAFQLAEAYGEAADRVRELAELQGLFRAAEISEILNTQATELRDLASQYITSSDAGGRFETILERITEAFGVNRSGAIQLEQALENIYRAETTEAYQDALRELGGLLREQKVELENIPPELRRAIEEAASLSNEFDRVAEAARRVRDAVAGITTANSAVVFDLNNRFRRGDLLPGQGEPTTDNSGGRPRSTGARTPADTFATDLEGLRKRLRSEQEVIQEEYDKSQEMLADRRAQEILGEQGHKDALLDVERDYQEKLARLRDLERSARLQSVAGAFGDVASLMETGSKKLFAIGKAAAIAEATVSGYEAATEAWSKGMKIGGPPVAAAFTAASLARTGALISSINSTSIGGGAGGGVPAAAPAAANVNTSPRVALTLVGDDNATFSKSQVRDLINQINEATEDGAIVRLA